MIKGDTTLPWYTHIGAHASHPTESLLLEGGAASWAGGSLSSSKVEGSCTIVWARLAREGGKGRGILMRLDTGSELGFLFGKHANDASSDFVMNNCLVVFADNVNAKFLFEGMEIRVQWPRRTGRDIRQCHWS